MKENYTELYPNEHVSRAVGDYAAAHSTTLPEHILKYNAEMQLHEDSDMMTSPFQSQFQFFLAKTIGAKRVLEIGTFVGFSALVWSHAVGHDGQVTTFEFDPEYAEVAKKAWAEADAKNIEVVVGDARKTLKHLADTVTEPYDLVFIDADKSSYPAYLDILLSNSAKDSTKTRLLRPGALIVGDNVLRQALVADATAKNPAFDESTFPKDNIAALDRFNTALAKSERLVTFLLPLFDGLGMATLID